MTEKNGETPTRRQAIKRIGGGALVLGVSGAAALTELDDGHHRPGQASPPRTVDRRIPPLPDRPHLVVARNGDPRPLVRAAIDGLGGIRTFIERGDRVLIKPNIGWDRIPLLAANTNPVLVGAIVELCREAGAAQVIVGDVSCNDARRSYDRSGIARAAREAGADVLLPERSQLRQTTIGGEVLSRWPVFAPVLECNKLINVPIVKNHTLAGYTGALKNWYGLLGGRRSRLHQNIHGSIADLACFARPTLTVIDALRVMHRNGPTGGDTSDTRRLDTVIASVDQVGADAYACRFIGLQPHELPYLAAAERRGAGRADPDALRIHEVDLG